MKKLVILPGNSAKNVKWSEDVADQFCQYFDEVYAQEYEHWSSGGEQINFETELLKLGEQMANDTERGSFEHYIFAKSFGSVLALLSMHRKIVTPVKCVFFGIPLNLVRDQDIFSGEWGPLDTLSVPSLVFQNREDPVADYTYTTEVLSEYASSMVRVISCDGDTHGYTELSSYESDVKTFLEP